MLTFFYEKHYPSRHSQLGKRLKIMKYHIHAIEIKHRPCQMDHMKTGPIQDGTTYEIDPVHH